MRFATFYDNSFRFPEEVEIGTRFETNLLCISFVLFYFFSRYNCTTSGDLFRRGGTKQTRPIPETTDAVI